MSRAFAACCLLAVTAAPTMAPADQVVLFEDGRSMRAERVVVEDDLAVLTLEGGGRIAFPPERIRSWHRLAEATGPVAARELARAAAWREAAGEYAEIIDRVAREQGIDPALLTSMARVESAFDPVAVSPRGAGGLLQLMPATARRFGVDDVFDASQNLEAGARYLGWLLDRYSGRADLALAGYNAGEGAVDRHRGVPPYAETRAYVSKVLHGAERLSLP
jgi:soluble lytic murein transglycosylase-like protein